MSDASRGAIIVHDTVSGWIAMACAPSAGLQMVLVKQSLMHNSLLMVRIPHPGILEYDTASLQRKHTHTPVRGIVLYFFYLTASGIAIHV